jgi:hypothetical protein
LVAKPVAPIREIAGQNNELEAGRRSKRDFSACFPAVQCDRLLPVLGERHDFSCARRSVGYPRKSPQIVALLVLEDTFEY